MQMYQGLDDPDALTGAIAMRSSGATHEDSILAAQKMGRWSEVEALYEVSRPSAGAGDGAASSALQQAAGALRHARDSGSALARPPDGYLHSLLAANKPKLLLDVAAGWAQCAGADVRTHAAAAGVAAGWRLGDWGATARFLQVSALQVCCRWPF